MRVLVIEDDEELPGTVAAGLRHARMAVDVALDGQAGLTRALVNDYDVIVLDRDLPGIHGDEVCAKLLAAGGRSRGLNPSSRSSSIRISLPRLSRSWDRPSRSCGELLPLPDQVGRRPTSQCQRS
jgi:CheY-like chemotaxis protein